MLHKKFSHSNQIISNYSLHAKNLWKKCTFLDFMYKFWHCLHFKIKICDNHIPQKKNQKAIQEFGALSSLEISFCCFQSWRILDFK